MKPKSIGIIGGAGPLAGAFLLDRVLSISSKKYGCYKDADFPEIFLISFPFSEMLSPNLNIAQLRKELRQCINQLRQNGAAVLSIAWVYLYSLEAWNFKRTVSRPYIDQKAKKIAAKDIGLYFDYLFLVATSQEQKSRYVPRDEIHKLNEGI